MKIKISEDFTKTVLGSMEENYQLKINEKLNSDGTLDYVQSIILSLKNKVIRDILHAGTSDFIFICCSEFDQDLDVQSSMDEEFLLSIPRRIEPNCITVLDSY